VMARMMVSRLRTAIGRFYRGGGAGSGAFTAPVQADVSLLSIRRGAEELSGDPRPPVQRSLLPPIA